MKKNLLWLLFTVFFVLFVFCVQEVFAITESECDKNWRDHNEECRTLWTDLRNEASQKAASLQNDLTRIKTNIKITTALIFQTEKEVVRLEKEIADLEGKIGRLDFSLDKLSEILAKRIAETYKKGKVDFVSLFLSSQNFSDFVSRFKYLRVVQLHDRSLMVQMETTRTNFEDQKTLKEQKQEELAALKKKSELLKKNLDQQNKDIEYLLEVTKNDERRYQQLINQAIAEQIAIKGILAGQGSCSEVGDVSEGQRIASLIQGSSCNSSGTHLHFMVVQDNNAQNPFNYLKSGADYKNCSGSSCGSNDCDPFNPSGSWDWPIDGQITLNQGYGKTWAIDHTWVGRVYQFHNGIDIIGSSLEVKAVKSGKLSRCVFVGSFSCSLPYVKVDHTEGNLETLYLHVNY
jgi:peptidoglycan hydrolase CwlO-like protein